MIDSLKPRGTAVPMIRVGPVNDGGYLVPDDLLDLAACISPGVSVEVGFDIAMANLGIDVLMADASVQGPPQINERFKFIRKYLDVFEDEEHIRLETVCNMISKSGDLILQMDIEGAEWRVLLDTSCDTLRRFRIIVVEFHDLHEVFSRVGFEFFQSVFKKLLQNHAVVHLHPNNIRGPLSVSGIPIPPIMEITFYRRDRFFSDHEPRQFPHDLDSDNVTSMPSVDLPVLWRPGQ